MFVWHRRVLPSLLGQTSSQDIRRRVMACTYRPPRIQQMPHADSDKRPATGAVPVVNPASLARKARSNATSLILVTSAPPVGRPASFQATPNRVAPPAAPQYPISTEATTQTLSRGPPRWMVYISQFRTVVTLTHPRPTCTLPPVHPPLRLRQRPDGARIQMLSVPYQVGHPLCPHRCTSQAWTRA